MARPHRTPVHEWQRGYMYLLEGRRGRGKSYLSAWLASEWALCEGIPVATNYRFEPLLSLLRALRCGRVSRRAARWWYDARRVVDSWDALFALPDGYLIIIDEAARALDSRTRAAPPVALEWFQQSRKLMHTVVLISQSFDWLDVRIRQLADYVVQSRVERRNRPDRRPVRFHYYGFDPWLAGYSSEVVRRADWRYSLDVDPYVYCAYDTHELVATWDRETTLRRISELRDWQQMKMPPP